MYEHDKRVVLTLDAGGTNFVFSAIQGNNEMISPISLPAVSDNLDECLEVLVKGFDRVIAAISVPPVAISFAFPGPADYTVHKGQATQTFFQILLHQSSSGSFLLPLP